MKRKLMFILIITFNLLFVQAISAIHTSQKIINKPIQTNDTNPCDVVRDIYGQLSTKVEGLKDDGYPVLANLMAGILGFLGLAVNICEIIEGGTNIFGASSCPLCST